MSVQWSFEHRAPMQLWQPSELRCSASKTKAGKFALATVRNVSVISEIREELIFLACKVFIFKSLENDMWSKTVQCWTYGNLCLIYKETFLLFKHEIWTSSRSKSKTLRSCWIVHVGWCMVQLVNFSGEATWVRQMLPSLLEISDPCCCLCAGKVRISGSGGWMTHLRLQSRTVVLRKIGCQTYIWDIA